MKQAADVDFAWRDCFREAFAAETPGFDDPVSFVDATARFRMLP
jgi:hypothetical protein